MKLKAKIKPELLDQILSGEKSIEARSLETITLTDGKRSHTFRIYEAEMGDWEMWAQVFPKYFARRAPVLIMHLGEEVPPE